MLIETNALTSELPALGRVDLKELLELLPASGFPVDAVEEREGARVLDVDVTANRGDVLSQRGMARDLAALLDAELAPLDAPELPGGQPLFPVRLEAGQACPVYATAILELGRGGTPEAVRAFLAAMGQGAKGLPAVDASNELLYRYGHPTHAFDADTLKGALVVRWAREGEKLVTLDGVERTLTARDLVIADETRAVALAGVMGGEATKVTEATRRVLLESAWFEPRSVQASARRHGLHTDASHRFGRGADPAMAPRARDLLVQRLQAWSGARLVGAWQAGRPLQAGTTLTLPAALLDRVAGELIPLDEAAALLRRLGCAVARQAEDLRVQPPSWRHDLVCPEALAGEVLRLRGFHRIGAVLPPLEGAPETLSPAYLKRRRLARRLAHLGFHQTVTLGFISPEAEAGFAGADNPAAGRTLMNPLGHEYSVMRASLLPSLLEVAARNQAQGVREVRLFEIAPVHQACPGRLAQKDALAVVWHGVLGGEDPLSPVRDLQQEGELRLRGVLRDLGLRGEPLRLLRLPLPGAAAGSPGAWCAEVALEQLPDLEERVIPSFTPFSRTPSVERDLSLLVGLDLAYRSLADALTSVLEAQAGDSFRELRCVDVFRHKSLPQGRQAWLLRLRFQHPSRTLTSAEADTWVAAALAAARELGAELRG